VEDQFNLSLDPETPAPSRRDPAREGAKVAHLLAHVRPHFCLMKITQDVRELPAKHGSPARPRRWSRAAGQGAVKKTGGQLYVKQ